jgi:hypothetical protein
MPELIKLYIRNVIIGFVIAAAFVAMLLWFNVMNLWHLVSTSDVGILAVLILWFSHGVVFAGVQFALAVMSMAQKQDDDRGGTPAVQEFLPVPVRVDEPRDRQRRRG